MGLPQLGFGVPYFNTFFLKEPLSVYFSLPGYLKAGTISDAEGNLWFRVLYLGLGVPVRVKSEGSGVGVHHSWFRAVSLGASDTK